MKKYAPSVLFTLFGLVQFVWVMSHGGNANPYYGCSVAVGVGVVLIYITWKDGRP
jgi:hypothetical protein